MIAEFNLAAVPAGHYQVTVIQGATSVPLPFDVTGGIGAQFGARLIMPNGLGLNTVNTAYVEYENSGDLPMVAPLLAVRGDGIGIPYFSLDPSQVSRDFWAASQPSFSRQTVTFFATGRIPGILLPGESMRVPINIVGIGPHPAAVAAGCVGGGRIIGWRLVDEPPPCALAGGGFLPRVVNIHLLQFLPPSILNVGSGQSQPDQPLSWASLRTNVPPNVPAEAWEAIWRNYTNAVGGTMYSFFGALEQNVNYLFRLGLLGTAVNSMDDLTAFELAQAEGLHVLRTLATATDGYAPTPGLRLSFDRSFPNTISTRHRLGALGRGWSHNWEERLSTNSTGDVIIVGQGGSQRTFKPDVRGGYLPDLGDTARLISMPGGIFSLREKGGLAKEFRADGKLNFVADPNGNRITCGYNGERLTSLAHSSGQRLDLAYNAQGRIQSITDTIGRATQFTYHGSGEQLATAEYSDGRTLRYRYVTGQGLQREHALTQIEFPDQSHQFFTYNSRGRLHTMSRDGGNELVTYTYDSAGTVLATDAFDRTTKFLFDNRGLLVRMENPKGEVVQLRHDERFNLTGVTDPAGRSFDYTYDRQGNLTEIVNPLGHRTRFAYEPQFQRLSQLTDAKGNPTRYNYDDRGNLRGITYANNKSENWGYDAIGNPTTWTNRRRNNIQYQFNPTNGFLMAKLYPDGSRADYEYDARGNLTAASNYTGRITLDYFPANDRLQRITYPGNRWLDYTYDDAGRRRAMTDQLGYQLRYDYDTVGRLRSITNSDNLRLVHYEYDPAGRMALKTLGNGVYTTYGYDDAGRLEKLTNALPNGSALSFFNYTYDERGRRTATATHYGAWTYGYDDLGQLTSAVLASTDPQIPNQNLTYLYDAMGNRVRTVENGVVTDYTANKVVSILAPSTAQDLSLWRRRGKGCATFASTQWETSRIWLMGAALEPEQEFSRLSVRHCRQTAKALMTLASGPNLVCRLAQTG
jgi:YD repeat-containing protein